VGKSHLSFLPAGKDFARFRDGLPAWAGGTPAIHRARPGSAGPATFRGPSLSPRGRQQGPARVDAP
jgi:hypothetical protein